MSITETNEEKPADNVVPFTPVKERLARGGGFSGGPTNVGGDGDNKFNYLRHIPRGARFLAKAYKNKDSFVLDQFQVYNHMENVTALEPIIPGMDTLVWFVDQQAFCNAYKFYLQQEAEE